MEANVAVSRTVREELGRNTVESPGTSIADRSPAPSSVQLERYVSNSRPAIAGKASFSGGSGDWSPPDLGIYPQRLRRPQKTTTRSQQSASVLVGKYTGLLHLYIGLDHDRRMSKMERGKDGLVAKTQQELEIGITFSTIAGMRCVGH